MPDLEQWRCPGCQRLRARMHLASGSVVEIRCRQCGLTSTIDWSGQVAQLRMVRPATIAVATK